MIAALRVQRTVRLDDFVFGIIIINSDLLQNVLNRQSRPYWCMPSCFVAFSSTFDERLSSRTYILTDSRKFLCYLSFGQIFTERKFVFP